LFLLSSVDVRNVPKVDAGGASHMFAMLTAVIYVDPNLQEKNNLVIYFGILDFVGQ
jgi:hypothetical protein